MGKFIVTGMLLLVWQTSIFMMVTLHILPSLNKSNSQEITLVAGDDKIGQSKNETQDENKDMKSSITTSSTMNVINDWPENRSRDIRDYIDVNHMTNRVDLPAPKLKESLSRKRVLVAVQSAPLHQEARILQRKFSGKQCNLSMQCDMIFVIGKTTSTAMQSKIKAEARMYKDILQEDFMDSYNNLTLKTLYTMRYFTLETQHTHLLKLDDDCYLNVDALLWVVNHPQLPANALIGHGQKPHSLEVIRPGTASSITFPKWTVPLYLYKRESYPAYLNGPGYLVTREAAECLLQATFEEPLFHLEDVYTTGLLRERCTHQTEIVHCNGFMRRQQILTPHNGLVMKRLPRLMPRNVLVHQDRDADGANLIHEMNHLRQKIFKFHGASWCPNHLWGNQTEGTQ